MFICTPCVALGTLCSLFPLKHGRPGYASCLVLCCWATIGRACKRRVHLRKVQKVCAGSYKRCLCRLVFCDIDGAEPVCPPGMGIGDACLDGDGCIPCPEHRDCYVQCSEEQFGSWIPVFGSPYNDQAFCERFPRNLPAPIDAVSASWVYLAQAGHSSVARHNFDNIYNSIITIFQILTGGFCVFRPNVIHCSKQPCPCIQRCM